MFLAVLEQTGHDFMDVLKKVNAIFCYRYDIVGIWIKLHEFLREYSKREP